MTPYQLNWLCGVNDGVICELRIREYVEGSGRRLF
jgi:hypothetical protein